LLPQQLFILAGTDFQEAGIESFIHCPAGGADNKTREVDWTFDLATFSIPNLYKPFP